MFRIKLFEQGVEHSWDFVPKELLHGHIKLMRDLQGEVVKVSVWSTHFKSGDLFMKETVFRDKRKEDDTD